MPMLLSHNSTFILYVYDVKEPFENLALTRFVLELGMQETFKKLNSIRFLIVQIK